MSDELEHAVVDRIVDGQAVLLVGADEDERQLPIEALPEDAGEGDWLYVTRSAAGELRIVGVDHSGTAARREELSGRLDRLRRTRTRGRFPRRAD